MIFKKAATKLSNSKSLGLNGVPPNASKALDKKNLTWLLLFYNKFWRIQADSDQWHEGQIFPVPKRGDTYNPNKWWGITPMHIGNKIYSSIMCGQLFKIISKQGVKCQFGYTPGVVYQDGIFMIKTLLHLRHNQNLPTYVEFADLVKAFNTSNHALIISILGNMALPQGCAHQSNSCTTQSYSM